MIFILLCLPGNSHADTIHITDIRVGAQPDKTRLVLDLSAPLTFNPSVQNNQLVIPFESAKGHKLLLKRVGSQSFPLGLIDGVHINRGETGEDFFVIDLEPGTKIEKSFQLDAGEPRFVIDLVKGSESVVQQFVQEAESATAIPPSAPEPTAQKSKDHTIKSLSIGVEQNLTSLIFGMESPLALHVKENDYMRRVIIEMPKTNWSTVAVLKTQNSGIENYFVDQSQPDRTNLVITLKPDITVLEKGLRSEKGNDIFEVVLGPAHTPVIRNWGRGTVENWGQGIVRPDKKEEPMTTPKPDLQKNQDQTVGQVDPFAYQTLEPVYTPDDRFEGGNAPFADFATGFYAGIMTGYGIGVNNLTYTNTHFSNGMRGFSGGAYAGYGLGAQQFYGGIEAFIQVMNTRDHFKDTIVDEGVGVYKNRMQWGYGITARLGYYLAPEAMVYGRIGAAGTRLKHSYNVLNDDEPAVFQNFYKNMAGVIYGVGIEAAISSHLGIRFEYMRTNYQHFTHKIGGSVVRYAPKVDQFILGLTYQLKASYGPSAKKGLGIIPSGIYAGTGLDFSSFLMKTTTKSSSETLQLKTSALAPAWDFYFGYGHASLSGVYMGAEAMASFGTNTISNRYIVDNKNHRIADTMESTYGAFLRPGMAFGHGNLVYIKIGGVVSSFKHQSDAALPASLTSGKNASVKKVGYAFGAGLEAFLSDVLSIRGEYVLESYPSFKAHSPTIHDTLKASKGKFQIGLSYTLGN